MNCKKFQQLIPEGHNRYVILEVEGLKPYFLENKSLQKFFAGSWNTKGTDFIWISLTVCTTQEWYSFLLCFAVLSVSWTSLESLWTLLLMSCTRSTELRMATHILSKDSCEAAKHSLLYLSVSSSLMTVCLFLFSCLVLFGGENDDDETHTEEHKRKRKVESLI